MKKIFQFILATSICILCHAQKDENLLDQHPAIYYFLYNDDEMFSEEWVVLFSDSSCYIEFNSPQRVLYAIGRYTCRCDSLFFTSNQILDTLDILDVEEYYNPESSLSTITVLNEEYDTIFSRFLIDDLLDTLWTDPERGVLLHERLTKEIKVSVGLMKRFSRYSICSPKHNVFNIRVNSMEKHAENSSFNLILENQLFLKRNDTLFDTALKRNLKLQEDLPDGLRLNLSSPHNRCLLRDYYKNDIFRLAD